MCYVVTRENLMLVLYTKAKVVTGERIIYLSEKISTLEYNIVHITDILKDLDICKVVSAVWTGSNV